MFKQHCKFCFALISLDGQHKRLLFCQIFRTWPSHVSPSVMKSVTRKQHNLFDQSVADIYWAPTNPWVLVWPEIVCYSKCVSLFKLPPTCVISGWATGFHRCLNTSGTTRHTEHNSLPAELALSLSQLSLCEFSPHRHQGAGLWQRYLLWQRIMMPSFLSAEHSWSHMGASVVSCR